MRRRLPDLAMKSNRTSGPRNVTCSRRSVVSPTCPLSRAYRSHPTRNRPTSSSRTASASARSRSGRSRARRPFALPLISGSRSANSSMSSNFSSSRRARHSGWYRYWRRPLRSKPVACRWAFGAVATQTSVQAGGIRKRPDALERLGVGHRIPARVDDRGFAAAPLEPQPELTAADVHEAGDHSFGCRRRLKSRQPPPGPRQQHEQPQDLGGGRAHERDRDRRHEDPRGQQPVLPLGELPLAFRSHQGPRAEHALGRAPRASR